MATASAMVPTSVLFIEKNEMMRVLQTEHAFSDPFIHHMLTRIIRIEEDLVDQLFNSSEKRLACTLLLLARFLKLFMKKLTRESVGPVTQGRPAPRIAPQSIARDAG